LIFTFKLIFFSRWCAKIQYIYVCSQVEGLYIDDAPLSYDMTVSWESHGENIT